VRSPSRLGKLWKRLGAGVVEDVPPSLEECEACRELECTQERWASCERRLATEAAALNRAKSGELPEVAGHDAPTAQPAEPELAKISNKVKPAES
jgi:hypothetical protein